MSVQRKPRGTPFDVEYFFSRSIPEPNSGCWIWLGAMRRGYGVIRMGRRTVAAHRAVLEVSGGQKLLSTEDACHRCDLRCCVNPDHLFKGTRLDNMRDCSRKGRIRVPMLRGTELPTAKFTDADIRDIRGSRRSQRALARAYGVDKRTIAFIRQRKTWRHI